MREAESWEMSNDLFEVLEGLRAGLNEANKRLSQIQDALFGNREFGQIGMISRLEEHEERLRRLERTRVSSWQVVMVVVTLAGAGALMDARLLVELPFTVAAAIAVLLVGLVVIFLVAYGSQLR